MLQYQRVKIVFILYALFFFCYIALHTFKIIRNVKGGESEREGDRKKESIRHNLFDINFIFY